MLRLAPLILRNVLRNRRRSLLTLASMTVSLALLALLLALYQGLFYGDDVSPSSAKRLITRHKVSLVQPLPVSHRDKIATVPGIVQVAPYTWFGGKFKDETIPFARFASDATNIFDILQDYELPADQLATFKSKRASCVVAEKIARDFNLSVGQRITIKGDIYPVDPELEIVGIFKCPPQTEALIFHRQYLAELLGPGSPQQDLVGAYIMICENTESMNTIARNVDDMFDNSPYPTRTESEKEFTRAFLEMLGNIKLFLGAICAAVTFTIVLVSANTVAMSVRERTREMAVLRTLGYSPGEIMTLVLGEAIFLSTAGSIVGLVLGSLLAKALTVLTNELVVLPPIKPEQAAVVLGVAIAVGVLASLVPAFVTSRKNLVESLRFTG